MNIKMIKKTPFLFKVLNSRMFGLLHLKDIELTGPVQGYLSFL